MTLFSEFMLAPLPTTTLSLGRYAASIRLGEFTKSGPRNILVLRDVSEKLLNITIIPVLSTVTDRHYR